MKITDIETMALAVPLDQPIFFATRKVQERDLTITKITTDDGIVGVSCIPIGEPFSVGSIIERKLTPLLIGKDPLCTEWLWDMMYMEMRRDPNANIAYGAPTAIKVGRALEEQDAYFFEAPVRPDDLQGSEVVADALDIPVASGELEYTIWGFRDLITSRAIDIIQPDATVLGGITEFMKVAAFAKAYHMPVSPHWE